LEVAPAALSLGTGGWFALRATAILDDGSVLDVTPLAAWTSSAPGIVQVGNGPEAGHGLGVDAGVAPVMVAMGGATAVTAASITTDVPTLELWPPLLQRTVQTGAALRATAVWPAGDSLDVTAWTVFLSSDPSVATVSNADGRRGELAALAPGSAQVIAQFLGVASRTAVTVGAAAPTAVAVTGPAAIPSGQPVAFQATAHFTDGSDQDVGALASWTSSANATLRVRGVGPDRGTASGLAPGQAEARALYLGISGATPVMVGAPGPTALVVEGPTGPLPSGVRVPLVARATFPGGLQLDVTARASWFSSAPGVAAVGNGPIAGWVEARLSGTAQVTATFQDLQAVAPVAVSPASLVSLSPLPPTPTGPVGVAVPIRVEGNFSDGSQVDLTAQARWASSDPSRLVISNGAGTRGLAMALVAGSTQFSVSVARPDGSQLVASALFAGAPAVPVGVEISPAAVELSISSSPRLTLGATALFSDGTAQDVGAQVSWSSADAGVASVSATGVLTAEAVGQTQVSAVLGTVVGTAPVEVVP
ncbi:MAG TPA: Ig-like domain-containing protein, partial [Myxococcaceae bacterium]|nr:Ig-like domain-containing protein [Myxococcaceae bacterium]